VVATAWLVLSTYTNHITLKDNLNIVVFMQLWLIITLPCDCLFEVLPIAILYCHICIIDDVEVVVGWLIIPVACHTHEHLICIGSLSQTYGCYRIGMHCTLPEEGCDVKVAMHCICTFEVHLYWSFMLAWSSGYEEYSFSFIWGVLFYSHVDIVYLLDKYSYHAPLFIMTCILLWLHHCLIKL
jgi:hypothetical protein